MTNAYGATWKEKHGANRNDYNELHKFTNQSFNKNLLQGPSYFLLVLGDVYYIHKNALSTFLEDYSLFAFEMIFLD